MSELTKPVGEFHLPEVWSAEKDENPLAPPKGVVDHNLESYPEAHKAEVIEAFNQAEREEQAQKSDAA